MRIRFGLVIPAIGAITAFAAGPVSAQSAPAPSPIHVLVDGTSYTQAADATPVKKNAEPMPRRGFNVVLLVGDMQSDTWGAQTVPVAAQKALADMKDFLPYKGYRLVDTQWVLASNSGPAVVRLRGWEYVDYDLELRASPAFVPNGAAVALSPTALSVRFLLREAGDSSSAGEGGRTVGSSKETKSEALSLEIGREIFQLERERDDLQPRITKGRKDVDVGMASPDEVKRLEVQLSAVTRRIAELKQSLVAAASKVAGRTVIDTSFRMDEGETVVVGTSRVKGGDKALIALLTATSDRPKGSSK